MCPAAAAGAGGADPPGEGEQLGDVVVPGAPVVAAEQPAADVALAGGGAGDAGAQVQGVAELLLSDPGGQDLLPVPAAAEGVHDLGELEGQADGERRRAVARCGKKSE